MAKNLEEIIGVLRGRWGLRTLALFMAYFVCLSFSHFMAWQVRFDAMIPATYDGQIWETGKVVIPISLLFLALCRQFTGIISFFGVRDLIRLLIALLAASVVVALLHLIEPPRTFEPPPRGVILINFVLSFLGLGSLRLAFRLYRERGAFRGMGNGWNAKRVSDCLIGQAACMHVKAIQKMDII